MSSPTKVPANMTSGVIKTAEKASATGTSGSSQVGAVVQLNSSEKIPSQYLSTGVHLGGIDSAHLLDDYEEGTWTVNLTNTTETLGNATGLYTKVGRLVHVFWYSAATTLASSSGTAVINLPFVVSNTAGGLALSTFHYIHGNAVSDNSTGGYFAANSSSAYWVKAGTTTGANFVNGTNDRYIMMSGSYITDS